jgi:hypothetical protein
MHCLVTVGKYVLTETMSSLSLGNHHHNNRRIVGCGVFCWVRPEVIQGPAGKPDVFKLALVWPMVVWEERAH